MFSSEARLAKKYDKLFKLVGRLLGNKLNGYELKDYNSYLNLPDELKEVVDEKIDKLITKKRYSDFNKILKELQDPEIESVEEFLEFGENLRTKKEEEKSSKENKKDSKNLKNSFKKGFKKGFKKYINFTDSIEKFIQEKGVKRILKLIVTICVGIIGSWLFNKLNYFGISVSNGWIIGFNIGVVALSLHQVSQLVRTVTKIVKENKNNKEDLEEVEELEKEEEFEKQEELEKNDLFEILPEEIQESYVPKYSIFATKKEEHLMLPEAVVEIEKINDVQEEVVVSEEKVTTEIDSDVVNDESECRHVVLELEESIDKNKVSESELLNCQTIIKQTSEVIEDFRSRYPSLKHEELMKFKGFRDAYNEREYIVKKVEIYKKKMNFVEEAEATLQTLQNKSKQMNTTDISEMQVVTNNGETKTIYLVDRLSTPREKIVYSDKILSLKK